MSLTSNIKNKYTQNPITKLSKVDYWDFHLCNDESRNCNTPLHIVAKTDNCLYNYFKLNELKDVIKSERSWVDKKVSTIELNNVGLTCLDSGYLDFDLDNKNDCEYCYDKYLNSKLNIDESYDMLNLKRVYGYNKPHITYDINEIDEGLFKYLEFNGGFYQGFYKLHGYDYQVLPNRSENEMSFMFDLHPKNLINEKQYLNDLNPNNKGIFFYMGIKAENKFFNVSNDIINTPITNIDHIFFGCEIEKNIKTSSGLTLLKHTYDVTTDNKFLFYDKTRGGLRAGDEPEGYIFKNEQNYQEVETENKFITYNKTKTGLQVECEKGFDKNVYVIDTKYDVSDNAFALIRRDNGSIGYRLITMDCNKNLVVEEEYSKTNLVSNDIWTNVIVRMIFDRPLIECNKQRKFKLYFYVNDKLEFISKELNELMFRPLTCDKTKQETVPYNISIGGGTLGLSQTIYPGYSNNFALYKDIENQFCGTFIGGIRKFGIYYCQMDYEKIFNDYKSHLF
jgi:hypothetical protein